MKLLTTPRSREQNQVSYLFRFLGVAPEQRQIIQLDGNVFADCLDVVSSRLNFVAEYY